MCVFQAVHKICKEDQYASEMQTLHTIEILRYRKKRFFISVVSTVQMQQNKNK